MTPMTYRQRALKEQLDAAALYWLARMRVGQGSFIEATFYQRGAAQDWGLSRAYIDLHDRETER